MTLNDPLGYNHLENIISFLYLFEPTWVPLPMPPDEAMRLLEKRGYLYYEDAKIGKLTDKLSNLETGNVRNS